MSGEQHIAASRQRVWDALNDLDVLRRAIPGCQSLEQDGDGRLRASVAIKIGPIDARLSGAVALSDLDPPHGYTMSGEGQGAAGSAKGAAKVRLIEEAGATRLCYEVDAQMGGRLAQLGGPLIDAAAKQMAANFFRRFGEVIVPPVEAPKSEGAGQERERVKPAPPASALSTMWTLGVVASALIGFLVARTPMAPPGSLIWIAIVGALVIVVVAAIAFDAGRRTASPIVMLDAALLDRIREIGSKS